MRARLKIRPLLLRRHQRHDRGKVVRQRRSTDGKGGMRRHKANSAVGAREVQLSSTDPRSARCGGGMLARSCSERVCGFQRTQNVPPSPKEVSSIACPTHWTRVHNASTSRKWCDGVKCALALDGRALPGGRLGSEKSTMYVVCPFSVSPQNDSEIDGRARRGTQYTPRTSRGGLFLFF